MLRFILGTGGTGKTAYIHNKIKELALSGEQEVLMLVPDQSSFETEKAFLDLLGARLCKNVSVFGFEGLCRYVFQRTRNVPRNVIDNGTRAVLMNLALEQLGEKLSLLKSKNSRAVSDMLLSTLSECKKNGITSEMLRAASQYVGDQTLSRKLFETALVFDAFDALLAQSYIDPLDNLTRVIHILSVHPELISNKVVFIDAFSGFTKVQLDVIRIFLNNCREVNVALTLDPLSDGTEDVFKISHATLKTIKAIAKRDFVDIKTPIKLTEPLRFQSEELRAAENGIFRRYPSVYDGDPENVMLYAAADIYDECAFVARRIKELIMEQGMRYSDISVICRDAKPYRGVLDVTLEKYDIPYFTDVRRDITVKPVMRFINAVFRLILDGFAREDVLSLLKTGLTDNTLENISVFENYCYVWNISGKALMREFTQNPRGFADSFTDADRQALAAAEAVRRSVIVPIAAFYEDIKDKTGREITERLYRLLETLKVPDVLGKLADELEAGEEKGLGTQQLQVWRLLMDALDKTVAAVGDLPLSPKRYYELLSIQISNLEFSQIPQTLDCVTVTTAQRVRVSGQKAVFVIGCNDGSFPAQPHSAGLFSSFELKQLMLNEINLGDDFSYIADLELFMAYCALTAPSHRLYASFPAVNMDGEKLSHSVIIDELTRMFPRLRVCDRYDFDSRRDAMLALAPAFEEYARSLEEHSEELHGLGTFFEEHPRYASGAQAVKRALDRTPLHIENPENARMLFGENLTISASQVEKFSLCKFSYFCNYGLKVRERLKAEMNPMEYGTLVHYILERFFTQYTKEEYAALSEQEIGSFIRTTVTAYLQSYMGGEETKSGSFLYRLDVLCQNLLLLVEHLRDELVQSDFEVADCELKIGGDIPSYTVQLPTGQNIAVCGSVDRVDIMEANGEKYLRIIDYKTGSKKFKLSDILYGLNLQMLLYLCAIVSSDGARYGGVTPAGILYMPAVVPNITADGLDDVKIQKNIDDCYKMNGLLLDDVRVIKGMDKSEDGKYIPVKIKNGSNAGGDSLATLTQFGKIFEKLNHTVMGMGEELLAGRVEAVPLKGGTDACQYCPYDSVCGWRMGDPRYTFKQSAEEVYWQLDEENGGGEA